MTDFLTRAVPNDKAAAFIRSKPIVSRQAMDRMLPEVQALAFTVSGIERYDTLQRMRDLVAELPEGANWDEVKRSLAEELSPHLSSERAARARAELILRHNGLQSYRVTKWEQVQRHKDVFPYLMYLATRDEKTRDSHAALHGIILPVDDPFWLYHTGPWEWGCRCDTVQKTQTQYDALVEEEASLPIEARTVLDEAARRRLTDEGVLIRAMRDGQGRLSPPRRYDVRTPEQRGVKGPGTVDNLRIPLETLRDRYDADIWNDFETWAKSPGAALPDRDGMTVWSWLSGERGSTGAAVAVTGGSTAAGAAATAGAGESAATLVARMAEMDTGAGGRQAAHELLTLPQGQRGTLAHSARVNRGAIDEGFDFVNRMVSGTLAVGQVGIRQSAARAYADAAGAFINGKRMRARAVVHELGHILDARSAGLLQAGAAFRDRRTVGETPQWMGPGFSRREVALADEWAERGGHLYMGKVYKHPRTGKDYATEILSMGLERLFTNPVGFAKQDPDYLQFILEAIRP